MPILTIQRRMRELGRIRIGAQVPVGSTGKRRPTKLETFRLTSESRELIEAAAVVYGGTVSAWKNGTSDEWEVVTTRSAIPIVVPPGQPVSQWFELWSGGGCLRRCNGETNVLDMSPCACPADVDEKIELAKKGEACKATTRLSVMLPELPDLGVWRLESHGYYAATELAGAAEVLSMASATGRLIPANLRLEQREKKVPGKPTNKYAVPIIEFIQTTAADLGVIAALPDANRAALGSGQPAPVRSTPALPSTTLPADPTFSPPAPDTPSAPAEPPTPAVSPLRAPEPEPVEPPELAAALDAEVAAVSGEVIVPDEPEPAPAAVEAALAEQEEPDDPAVTPPTMTHEELKAVLAEMGVSAAYAVERSKALYPREAGTPLTDEQRAGLVIALRLEAETPPSKVAELGL